MGGRKIMDIELAKENIECEQLLSENSSDTVVRAEFVIPDTHPDVETILMMDAKPCILNSEVMQDKVYIEGQIQYNVLYLALEQEEKGIYSVTYTSKFSNYIESNLAEHSMFCVPECYVEHMECNIVNERKISLEGIITLKAELYKNYNFQIINDISASPDIQMLKTPATVDKVLGNFSEDLIAKSNIKVPVEKPQIGEVLRCDVSTHKSNTKLNEDKINLETEALITILYRGKNTRDIVYLEDNVLLNKEIEAEGVNTLMSSYSEFNVDAMDFNIKEDDLGENRIIDVESLIKSNTRIMYKDEINMIEDAYSPETMMKMDKVDYELNVMHGQAMCQSIIKEDIDLKDNYPKVSKIIMCSGIVTITDKKLVEDKVLTEGVLNVNILYKTFEEDNYIFSIKEEIPFNSAIEIPGSKIDMQCIVKAKMESIEAAIEIDSIAVKSVISLYSRVNYTTHKNFLVDIIPLEDEVQRKKSSITIYVVQQGDTLWKVAKKYGTTIEGIVRVNKIENQDIIEAGDKLIIPGRALI